MKNAHDFAFEILIESLASGITPDELQEMAVQFRSEIGDGSEWVVVQRTRAEALDMVCEWIAAYRRGDGPRSFREKIKGFHFQ